MMGLTNAERQRKWRDKRNRLAKQAEEQLRNGGTQEIQEVTEELLRNKATVEAAEKVLRNREELVRKIGIVIEALSAERMFSALHARKLVDLLAEHGLVGEAVYQKVKDREPVYVPKKDADILGLPSELSTRAEVTKAFRKKAKAYHPDNGGSPEDFQHLVDAKDRALGAYR